MNRKKINVVILITRMDLGGAQEVALQTAVGLKRDQFSVTLISGAGGSWGGQAKKLLGEDYKELGILKHPISPWNDFISILYLAWYFFWTRTDLVHTHSSKAGMVGRAAAWLSGVPAVVHTVHGWSFHDFMNPVSRRVYILLEKIMASVTDSVVVVANSLAIQGQLEGIAEITRYRTIRAASDLSAWQRAPSKKSLNSLLKLKRNPMIVGTVANAKEQKCPLDFVKVAFLVLKKNPQVHFVYVGDGPRRQAAQSLALTMKIHEHVHFVGWKNPAAALAAGFDIFLLTSLWEGLPCVFAQAMSLGLPIVASAVGGAAELIEEGKTGYLCQAHDTLAMADRVSTLLKSSVLRKRLGSAAKKAVGPEYHFDSMVKHSAALYQQLLSA